ncbi:MAG: class C sortase [Bacilli bacterium]|nr:class C sortase [Bacilli bacterium]
MKKNKTTFFMVLFFFIGLIVLLYPSISDYTNSKIQSKAIDNYEELVKKIDKVDYDQYLNEANEYNKALMKISNPLITYKKLQDASKLLDVNGSGVLGYISIDKINVELPIHYGTTESVLASSVGLLEGSSMPIGKEGTHAVLSAHRGLPSSKLFTNLDRMEIGDTFVLKVLNKTMTYEIDQIRIVEPKEIDQLSINPKQDYVTIMTCTPYGINTHRLLVRGHRVENAKAKMYVSTGAFKVDKWIITPIVCLPIIFIWLLLIAFKPMRKNINTYIEKYVFINKNKDSKLMRPSNNFEEKEYQIFDKYVYPSGINIDSY